MTQGIVKYETDAGIELTLSPQIIRDTIVQGNKNVTDAEVTMFLELCRSQKLNPFLRDAHLIKYGDQPATIVTGKETFTKRAERHPEFDGFEAGVTVVSNGKLVRREGSLVFSGEEIAGGWAKVYRKDRRVPFYTEVAYHEYVGTKKDGTPSRAWAKMPGTMIRKVALVAALREAFPDYFAGLYSPEEMNVDTDLSRDASPAAEARPVNVTVVETENAQVDVAPDTPIEDAEFEIVDEGDDEPEVPARDVSKLSALKLDYAEVFNMDTRSAEDAIRGKFFNDKRLSDMTDREYDLMIAAASAYVETHRKK